MISADDEWVGYLGSGAFNQSGGTNNLGLYGWLFLGVAGGKASYSLSQSGVLSANEEYVGDGTNNSGILSQSGGSNILSLYLNIGYFEGSSGTYSLTGNGYLSVPNTYIEYLGYSGTGTFTQSGGTNSSGSYLVLGYGSSTIGTYNLSGGSLYSAVDLYVGNSGSGSFTQSGGTNLVGTSVFLGYNSGSSGTYNLNGGFLSASYEFIGVSGTGSFTQTGGTNNSGSYLALGYYLGSSGTFNLNGGGLYLSSSGAEYVGYSGTGIVTQSGGVNNCGISPLTLGYNTGSSGTYNLNGGLLILSSLSRGSGSVAFNFNGGTLQASGSFSSNLPIELGTSGGGATFDTAGYAVTLSGALSGPGGLTKVGTGTLVLTTADTYVGGTNIAGGAIKLDFSQSGAAHRKYRQQRCQFLFVGLRRRHAPDPR